MTCAVICAECIVEMLGFAIAIPVAAIALARPVGFLLVLLLNKRFLPPPSLSFPEVDMIEAVSSSCPFLGDSHIDPPPAPPPPLLGGLPDPPCDSVALTVTGEVVNSGCLSMVGDSTIGVMDTFVSSA